jgi:hypothetical protein
MARPDHEHSISVGRLPIKVFAEVSPRNVLEPLALNHEHHPAGSETSVTRRSRKIAP